VLALALIFVPHIDPLPEKVVGVKEAERLLGAGPRGILGL